MFNAFENALKKNKKNYLLLKGAMQTRLDKAIKAIDDLLDKRENLDSFSENLVDLDFHLGAGMDPNFIE